MSVGVCFDFFLYNIHLSAHEMWHKEKNDKTYNISRTATQGSSKIWWDHLSFLIFLICRPLFVILFLNLLVCVTSNSSYLLFTMLCFKREVSQEVHKLCCLAAIGWEMRPQRPHKSEEGILIPWWWVPVQRQDKGVCLPPHARWIRFQKEGAHKLADSIPVQVPKVRWNLKSVGKLVCMMELLYGGKLQMMHLKMKCWNM